MDAFRQTRVVLSEAPGLFLVSVVLVMLAAGLYTAFPALDGAPMLYSLVVLAVFAVGLPLCMRLFASASALFGPAEALAFALRSQGRRGLRRRRASFQHTIERELANVFDEDLRNLTRPAQLERPFVNVNQSLQDVIESVRPVAEGAGVTIKAQLAVEPVFVQGDVFVLGRVCRNMILNALEATGQGRVITVSSARVGDQVVIGIMDTLGGILADRLALHFDLVFSTKSVEQIGGPISVTRGIDGGIRFVLCLPTVPQARPSEIHSRNSV